MNSKKKVSLSLEFDYGDVNNDLPVNQVPTKKKKVVSLSLFEDLLQPPLPTPYTPPPPPQTHKKVWLFGVDISSDQNIHHNSLLPPQTHETPDHSHPNLKRPLQDIIFLPNKRLRIQESNHPTHPEMLLPRILQQIQWNGGTLPIFLFQKRLTNSDIKSNQNRLFLSRRDKPEKLMEFLTDVERNQVDSAIDGVEVLTIDPKGDYHTLHLKRWPSIPMVVLKSQWRKLVSNNHLERDDWIQLWGYRQDSRLRLAFNFKKAQKSRTQGDGASSSGGRSNLDGSNSSSKEGSGDGSGPSGSGASIISVA
ncbi:Uncharacterized protein Adt_25869 [Abeliophyllum distichum]|uniref:TF-B3 domain-containing protein n=1 Tax=Abeliophyllum distichum TaxID=126358 RepID=A0ABD1RPQ7_9LAMI